MIKIVVSGGEGQLGKSLAKVAPDYANINLVAFDRQEWDILDEDRSRVILSDADIVINCAAYTAVDKAEEEAQLANNINNVAVGSLAKICKDVGTNLIHISTDYVYHNDRRRPLKETDYCCPGGEYALSKLRGEERIKAIDENSIIVRTSWLYSEFGNNFLKTMIRLGQERKELSIVKDQMGCPTYAADLARTLLSLSAHKMRNPNFFGLFNYANEGWTNWYEFAKEIFRQYALTVQVKGIPSIDYPTPASRPPFSIMDLEKISEVPGVSMPHWKDALKRCIMAIKLLD